MNLEELQNRLVDQMRERVKNGDLTERGFARSLGVSQVHIHNVLKGVRTLSINLNDLILKRLGLTIFDFCTSSELEEQLARSSIRTRHLFDLPLLTGQIGPGAPWSTQTNWQDRHPVPCFVAGYGSSLVVARLGEDREMGSSLGANDIAVLDVSPHQALSPDFLYVVDRGPDAVIRRVRPGAGKLYLAADANLDRPEKWESLQLSSELSLLRGRVCWLGKAQAAGSHLAMGQAAGPGAL